MTVLVLVGVVVGLCGLVLVDLVNLDHPQLDPIAHMASYFVHGRAGWLLVVAVLGMAFAAFAFVPLVRRYRAVAIAVALFGAGLVIAAVVPTQPVGN